MARPHSIGVWWCGQMMRGSDPERLCSGQTVLSGVCLFSSLRRDTLLPTLTREVVEDSRARGLILHQPPLAFLHADLHRGRDGQCVMVAGLVLVHKLPGRGVEASAIRCATRDFRWGK
jgi:hypothetical protein